MLLNNHNLNSLKLTEKVKDDNAFNSSVLFWITNDFTYVRSYDFIVKTSFVKTIQNLDFPVNTLGEIYSQIDTILAVQADSLRSLETHGDPDENEWLDNTAVITKIEPVREDGALIPSDSKIIELTAYNPITLSKNTVSAVTVTKKDEDLIEENKYLDYLFDLSRSEPISVFTVNAKKLIKILDDLSKLNNEVKIQTITDKATGIIKIRLESKKSDPQGNSQPIQEKVAILSLVDQIYPVKPIKE
jgi:hypothetical protein